MSDGYEIAKTMYRAGEEIERLRAENEKLQWDLGKALDTLVVHDAVCAENEKLRAALKPLADEAAHVPSRMADDDWYEMDTIKVGHIRAAAAALKETGDE